MPTYYELNKEKRLKYQKEYNSINDYKIQQYQQEYWKNQHKNNKYKQKKAFNITTLTNKPNINTQTKSITVYFN